MKQRLSEKTLRRFYRLLSTPMLDFDCGALCSESNDGVPVCCDIEQLVPVLFREEYLWHRSKNCFWRRWRPTCAEEEKLIETSADYNVFAECRGHRKCRRSQRSMTCRVFPFEPHLDKKGTLLGITYQYDADGQCPLVGKPESLYRPEYIGNSVRFWSELMEAYPEEHDLYTRESAKVSKRRAKKRKKVQVFGRKIARELVAIRAKSQPDRLIKS